jgi:organic radical activating enzyme
MNNKKKYEKIMSNKSFCLAPWVHIHSLPTGNIQPCCIWDYGEYINDPKKFGNINDSKSVKELLNSPAFKNLRKDFLNGKSVAGCHRCYDKERVTSDLDSIGSMRYWMNNFFRNEETEKNVIETKDDGTINDTTIQYLDIRFGNICNLKCRMCGHELSSTWYEEAVKLAELKKWSVPTDKFIHVDCYDKIEPVLNNVKEIYFAGGEPFLYPEHLKILDKLIEIGNTSCSIKYNTNLTTLKYKGRNLIDVWKNFPHVHIGASIDDMEDTVEYIRTNLKWADFVKNFDTILKEAPHVCITPSPTIGILNIETFVKFEKFCINQGWYDKQEFALNYIMSPNHLNLYYLPIWYKEKLIKMYEDHLCWLTKLNINKHSSTYTKIEELINRLSLNDHTDEEINKQMKKLKETLDMHDITGNLNWKKSLPHIEKFLKEHNLRSYNT